MNACEVQVFTCRGIPRTAGSRSSHFCLVVNAFPDPSFDIPDTWGSGACRGGLRGLHEKLDCRGTLLE